MLLVLLPRNKPNSYVVPDLFIWITFYIWIPWCICLLFLNYNLNTFFLSFTALVTTFNVEIGITGAILTKLDGDSRGGAALSVKEVLWLFSLFQKPLLKVSSLNLAGTWFPPNLQAFLLILELNITNHKSLPDQGHCLHFKNSWRTFLFI